MKIGVVIPTRGDRPQFLAKCLQRLKEQTLQPDVIELVDDKPLSDAKDITYRYRIGVERLLKQDVDLIFFIEDDDWYSIDYIKQMSEHWIAAGKPDILSFDKTIYYNLHLKRWKLITHPGRGSMFNTIVSAEAISKLKWCPDNEVWTDIHLWKEMKGITISFPRNPICVGIKHGIGLCGGVGHTMRELMFDQNDRKGYWLQTNVDAESYSFYSNVGEVTTPVKTTNSEINTIILSYSKTIKEYILTKNAIASLRSSETAIKFNVCVVETNSNLLKESFCDVIPFNDSEILLIFPNKPFNYNEFLKIGINSFDSDTENLLILNNDVEVEPGFASKLITGLTLVDSVSARCPIYEPHKKYKHAKEGIRTYTNGQQLTVLPGFDMTREKHLLCGWCIMTSYKVINSIGLDNLFPNELTFWYQDRYYGYLLQKKGYRHGLVLEAQVKHLLSQSYSLLDDPKAATVDLEKVFKQLILKK